MDTIKPNDSGINLSDAQLPTQDAFGNDEPDNAAASEHEYAQEPEIEVPSEEMIKARVIAMEDRVQRRQMIMTIQRWYNSTRFRQYLLENELVQELGGMTLPEMQALMSDIRFSISNKTTSDMIQRSIPQIIVATEPLISQFYDINGLGCMLLKSDQFKDLLEEVALDSQVFSDTPASTRLFYEIAKSAYFVHEANAQIRAERQIKQRDVNVSASTADLMK